MKRKGWLVLPGILGLAFFVRAQGQQAPPPVALVPVAGPVYMLEGGGGNIGVVADETGLVLIDAMFERSAEGIRQAVKALAGGGRVRVLVNTHWHSDHTDGNKAFGPGAVVVAHENIRALLAADQALMGGTTKALPAAALPGITFEDEITVYAGGGPIRLVHYPHAHTDGDTVVFIDGPKVVHMGDMFFNGIFPFMDVAHGGDIVNWVKDLDKVLAALPAGARIIPGHGPLGGAAELKAFRDMLAMSADHVNKLVKAGKSLDEIKAAGLPAALEPWAKGFMNGPRWLELVFRSLEKNKE
jgi:glyoxylase-like metal-dependent hydrolase (beta-lactamase superfamily II)